MLSKKAIKYKFLKHNIPNDTLDTILEDLYTKADEKKIIKSLIRKKIKNKININEKDTIKLINFLRRKGFYWNDIKVVAHELDLNF